MEGKIPYKFVLWGIIIYSSFTFRKYLVMSGFDKLTF